MPLLGQLLATLAGGAAGSFFGNVAKKLGFALTAALAMSGMAGALFIAMRISLKVASDNMIGAPAMFMEALQMVIPPVAPACMSTIATTWAACTVYAWRRDLAHMMASG